MSNLWAKSGRKRGRAQGQNVSGGERKGLNRGQTLIQFLKTRVGAWLVLTLALTILLCIGFAFNGAYLHDGAAWEAGVALRRVADFLTVPFRALMGGWPSESGAKALLVAAMAGAFYAVALVGVVAWGRQWTAGKGKKGYERTAGAEDLRKDCPEAEAEAGAISRRSLLKGTIWGAPAVLIGVPAWSTTIGPQCIHLRRYEVAIKDLPTGLAGLRMAHLSDFHYGRWIGPDHIRRAMRLALSAKPDIVLITGDFVTNDADVFERVGELAADEFSKVRLGVLATLGNHDHWTDAALARQILPAAGVALIDNQRRFLTRDSLTDQPVDGAICIGGVGDLWEDEVNFEAATDGAPGEMPRIVLSHNPDVAERYAGRRSGPPPPRIDLMLSGHTHGGQVYIPGLGAPIVPSSFGDRYAGGLVKGPHWPVLVSRGVGMAVLPVRFLCPPEVSVVTLVAG